MDVGSADSSDGRGNADRMRFCSRYSYNSGHIAGGYGSRNGNRERIDRG